MARRGPPHGPARSSDPPSKRYPGQFQVVEGGVKGYFDEYDAWPVSPFKLELETAEIYQDVTGACLSELESEGKINYSVFDGHKYIVSPDSSSPSPDPRIKNATNRFYDFFDRQSNAYFAELCAYVAICKVYDELPVSMDVHPKGNYPRKFRGKDIELDVFVEFFQERFPIEVYNGFQFVDDEHNKISELEQLSSDGEPMSNPVLFNRLSSPFSKKEVPKNGLIIDTRSILGCEENNENMAETVNILHIESHFELLPRIQTNEGLEFDGTDWHGAPDNYSDVQPSKMVPSASDLPDSYLRRIRGGLQFQYVSTLFRRMSEPVDQIAATVIQDIYHHLLRHPKGTPHGDVIDIGWKSYQKRHKHVKTEVTRFEPDIKERARELLSRLLSDDIVIDRGGELYARSSLHPHVSLDFNP